jgi:hypothetical protein
MAGTTYSGTITTGTTYSGAITTGITLNNPATQRPVAVTGTVTDNSTGAAFYGDTPISPGR